ncbi:MAG: beta-glucuronidase [Ruminococcaceae bacterium]|nr:beta-glucuronidase [Oscillospiraceae bacterium]
MKRLFNEHLKRKVTDLGGAWKFLLDPDKVGEEQGWYKGLPSGETVIVPSVWNNELGLLNYEGCGWYEKKIITGASTVLLEFESVMTTATVWLDGNKLGEHYGAFTQFEFIVNDVSLGEHTLVVRADSTIEKNSFPQRYTDWFNYGGIARDVFAHELEGISILTNHIVYELADDLKSAKVCAELDLYNACKDELSSSISVMLGETEIYNGSITLGGYERKSVVTPSVTLNDIALWDTDTPNLYTVVVSTDTDDLIDKVGFRKIEVKNGDILLNNKSIEFYGVNRHDEHPDWGFAFPAKLMKKDLDLICDMGCNTIRGSHYPNTKIFVDMLDERGILFWSEIPMWGCGFSWEALQNPVIIGRGLNMHKEMTRYYYNHPSIIIWGMHNEIDTSKDFTLDLTKQYYEHLREFGGNRLITHASNHPLNDLCMGYNDIVCINIYHGWYNYGGTGSLKDWDKFVVDLKNYMTEKGWFGKPVIMSEFGAAALAGFHSHFDNVRWSEEYQRDLLEYCIELFHKTDYMRGTYLWQFCNIRTSPSMDINRVRYFNNKGILDEYRNPKAAYFKVKELYKRYQGK